MNIYTTRGHGPCPLNVAARIYNLVRQQLRNDKKIKRRCLRGKETMRIACRDFAASQKMKALMATFYRLRLDEHTDLNAVIMSAAWPR